MKTGKTSPFLGCAYSGCSANLWDKDTIRGSGPVPEKPGPSLREEVQGWASSSDIIKFILPVKPQTEKGWARVAQQV